MCQTFSNRQKDFKDILNSFLIQYKIKLTFQEKQFEVDPTFGLKIYVCSIQNLYIR